MQKVQTLVLACLLALASGKANNHEQVHIALGTDETEMVVTWATMHHITDTGMVEFGLTPSNLSQHALAEVSHFAKDGASFYTYRALLTHLKPATQYYYRVGSKASSHSAVFPFRTLPSGNKWLPRFAVYGDLGFQNEESLPFLSKDVIQPNNHSMYDVIFHVGDMAYNLFERSGEQGHDFMRSIEKVAARVPYMTCPGNHEEKSNFSHYDSRFSMIADRARPNHGAALHTRLNNHFHSMDIGPAHIVMFSTEFYYYTQYGWEQIRYQYEWLEADLKRANANRAQRKWIIVMGHRPLYCLKIGDGSCNYETQERADIRQGIHMHGKHSSPRQYALEPLFYKYGVDIILAGHEHFYARLLPLYNYTVHGGASSGKPYTNAHAPVQITTGSAGNRENHPPFNQHLKSWVAAHHYDYGYTRLTFLDGGDRIHLEQTSDDQNGTVTDHVEIVKTTVMPTWLL